MSLISWYFDFSSLECFLSFQVCRKLLANGHVSRIDLCPFRDHLRAKNSKRQNQKGSHWARKVPLLSETSLKYSEYFGLGHVEPPLADFRSDELLCALLFLRHRKCNESEIYRFVSLAFEAVFRGKQASAEGLLLGAGEDLQRGI